MLPGMQATPQQPPLRTFQLLFGNVTFALVLFTILVSVMLPIEWTSDPLFLVAAALGVVSPALALTAGRIQPLPLTLPADEAQTQGVARFRTALFLRMVVIEFPVLLAMAFAFVLDTAVPVLVNAVIAIPLMVMFVFPTRRTVQDAEGKLDAGGARSQLSAYFGLG